MRKKKKNKENNKNKTKTKMQKQNVRCPNLLCEESVPSETYAVHMEECQFKIVNCAFCSIPLMKMEVETHLEICPKIEVVCPLGCDSRMTKGELVFHRNVCSHKKEKCKYCGDMISSAELQKHLKENSERHLELLLERVNKLESKEKEYMTEGLQSSVAASVPAESYCEMRRRRRRECLEGMKQKAGEMFDRGVQAVRSVVDVAVDKLCNSTMEQKKDCLSRAIFLVFLVFLLSLLLPWFIKLPLFFFASRRFYRRRIKPFFPRRKWILVIYVLFCWWIYARLL